MTGRIVRHAAWLAVLLLLLPVAVAAQGEHDGHGGQAPAASATPPDAPSHDSVQGRPDDRPSSRALPPFVPPLTDEDRRAAFPDVGGHPVHGQRTHAFILFDGVEWRTTGNHHDWVLDGTGWVGRDSHRLWFRVDGAADRRSSGGTAQVFYGRQVSRWWDLLFGVRQDLGGESTRTWAAVGLQGLAPYWFEVDLTAYVSGAGHIRGRMDVAYELLFTNRLILQPQLEVELASRSDSDSGIEAGLAGLGAGARLRYELRREFAPYIGVTWHRTTAAGAVPATGATGGGAFVTGIRFWF